MYNVYVYVNYICVCASCCCRETDDYICVNIQIYTHYIKKKYAYHWFEGLTNFTLSHILHFSCSEHVA